jgi:hypothetical protein
MILKTIIIGAYITHKIYWKRTHKQRHIKWDRFFPVPEK